MMLSRAIILFLKWGELEKNYSIKTITNYEHHIRYFFEWVGDVAVEKITLDKLIDYKKYLHSADNQYIPDKKIKDSTVGEKFKTIKRLFQFLVVKGYKVINPDLIPKGKPAESRLIFITTEEFGKICSQVL